MIFGVLSLLDFQLVDAAFIARLGVLGLFLGAVAGNPAAGAVAWQLYRQGLRRHLPASPSATANHR